MNYCINLKKRKNKPFCKLIDKEITFSQCQECVNKEYKTKNKENSFYKSNNHLIKNKSNKLTKLERKRTSVFTNNLNTCYLCGKKKEELHEIFAGRNRINSMKCGFVLPLCHECHSLNQNNPFFNDYWHRQAQEYFETNIGTREEFIRIFRRNYL